MLKIKLLLVVCLSALLSGCALTPYTKEEFDQKIGSKGIYYAYVINTKTLDDELKAGWCTAEKMQNVSAESLLWVKQVVCPSPAEWRGVVANFYGVDGVFVKTYLVVPVSANVESGDIVRFTRDSSRGMADRFDRIAAKDSEKGTKNCDWVGSKILNLGGVECEGWSYKNMPVFR